MAKPERAVRPRLAGKAIRMEGCWKHLPRHGHFFPRIGAREIFLPTKRCHPPSSFPAVARANTYKNVHRGMPREPGSVPPTARAETLVSSGAQT